MKSEFLSDERIECARNKYPLSFSNLSGGASEEKIKLLMDIYSNKIPEDILYLYRKFDGQRGGIGGLILGMEFLSIDKSLYFREMQIRVIDSVYSSFIGEQKSAEPDKIRSVYFDKLWFPLAHDGGGNFIGIDLNPLKQGRLGQIISFGRDEDTKKVLFNSIEELLDYLFEENSKFEIREYVLDGNTVTEFIFKDGVNSYLDTIK